MPRTLLFVWLLAVTSLAAPDDLKPSDAPMKEKLHGVIRQQLEAFRKNDFAGAYAFAASGIKAQFPAAAFEKMVRDGYPVIATSTDAVFGLTFDDGKRAVVSVRVIGANKQSATFQYLLEREGDDWRISGVVEQKENTETI